MLKTYEKPRVEFFKWYAGKTDQCSMKWNLQLHILDEEVPIHWKISRELREED